MGYGRSRRPARAALSENNALDPTFWENPRTNPRLGGQDGHPLCPACPRAAGGEFWLRGGAVRPGPEDEPGGPGMLSGGAMKGARTIWLWPASQPEGSLAFLKPEEIAKIEAKLAEIGPKYDRLLLTFT